MTSVDTIITARWVIPVEPDDGYLDHHSIAIDKGLIVALGASNDIAGHYRADVNIDLADHAIIPGLVNTHTHCAMSLFRGMADDLPLNTWLTEHIWPTEMKWASPEFVQDGSRLAIAEMLKGGTTCFADMYFFPDVVAAVAEAANIRACIGLIMIDMPTAWAQNAEQYLEKGIALHDQVRHSPWVSTLFAPHAPYTVSDANLERIRTLADELDIPIQMHVHETAREIDESVAQHGCRPLERIERLGLITPRLLAVHMTQLLDNEIQSLAEHGVTVVHCPESNLKLASGFCPVNQLMQQNVNVTLGTDGAASNNDLDMLAEMRCAALLAKGVSADPTAVPAHTALRMATLNGAQALGLGEQIGSLVPGKAADLTAVNLSGLATQPLYDPVSQLVYSASRDQVSDVFVGGVHVIKNHQLMTMDEVEILASVQDWAEKIKSGF
ncbi:MAG TPA: TRZ/ATZ family hydrolase [Acidiferrobacteraceae bacterium]|nr:TRZ/ATZ family hydrolase [Acidiferrobacteraceae bacterium]